MLTYGAETWTLTQKHKNKSLAAEVDYWRQSARTSRMKKLEMKQLREKWKLRMMLYNKQKSNN
jgi:hypothetical protein